MFTLTFCFVFFRRYDDPEYQDKLARVDSRTGQVSDQQVCIYSSFGNSFWIWLTIINIEAYQMVLNPITLDMADSGLPG